MKPPGRPGRRVAANHPSATASRKGQSLTDVKLRRKNALGRTTEGPELRSEPSNALRLRCLSHTSKHRVTPSREAGGDEFEPTVLKNPIILQPLPSPCIALL